MRSRSCLLAAALGCVCGLLRAAPPAPPPPEKYDVVVHYRIVAFQNERIVQFDAMLKDLAARGFRRDPNEAPPPDEAADSRATRLRGTVPAASARALLSERHVRNLLLIPAGEKLPDDANQPVRVAIELTGGLPPDRQRLLHEQTVQALGGLKFTEAVGYDTRGFTRIVGALPAGQLDAALRDLRTLPSGKDLPAPFAVVPAVRVIEVHPSWPVPAVRPAPPAVPAGQEKIASDLRELVADEARANQPVRFDLLLSYEPEARQRGWVRQLQSVAPGIAVEGILGSVVTVTAKPAQAPALAALPDVVGLRLPRAALPVPLVSEREVEAGIDLGLERLSRPGSRGKGNRIAVVAADFRGWEGLVGKGLPAGTTLIDLTRERHTSLEPDPNPAGAGPGQGTQFARLVAQAAPEASFVLIRVDPAAPYMLHTIARAIAGETADSLALEERARDLNEERGRIETRHSEILEERRLAFEDLREVDEAIKQREEYQKHQAAFDQEERAYHARLGRYLDLEQSLLGLKGVRAVASALIWDSDEFGGGNSVQRFLRERPFKSALWLEPRVARPRERWTGLFRDTDGNGVMEFVVPEGKLPKDSWTPEANFLAWQAGTAAPAADLPAGARVRVTVQWREPHDPALLRTGQDHFREPLTQVRLLVLRQLDAAGGQRPADDFEVVAQSHGLPHRLDQTPTSATYEVQVEFRVAAAGRYAVRVEGQLPESDRPATFPTLPSLRRTTEIRPRIAVDTLAGNGRAVWRDFKDDGGN